MRWLILHRWMGLAIAAFLVVSGLTGTIIAFKDPIDRLLNPGLLRVVPGGTPVSPLQIREIALRHAPDATVNFVRLHMEPDRAALVYMEGTPYDELYINPYTGEVLGERWQQAYDWDRKHLLPTIFWVHRTLLIRGSWGEWLLGTVAIVWVVSSLIGFYLTLPVRRNRFLSSWKRSWLIRPAFFTFDLHRAAGSWAFIVMLVIGVSAVRLSLYDPVYHPITASFLTFHETPAPSDAGAEPQLNWQAALERGRELMAAHVSFDYETGLSFDREKSLYEYSVKSPLDVRDLGGDTVVAFSAIDGRELGFFHPHAASGNAVEIWLEALHRSQVWGLPFRIFVSLMGLIVMVMAITGVLTWFKRRA